MFARIAAVSGAVALMLFFAWQFWVASVRPEHQANYHKADNHPSELSPPEAADQRIADYTEYLAGFTFLLAVVSSFQIWFLIRADKTARISADAAKQSANVAERTLEQASAPYIDVAITPKAIMHQNISGQIQAAFGSAGIFAEYVINNYGQSPAIVLEIYHYCIRPAGIPAEIPFPPLQTNLHQTFVIGGMKVSSPFPVQWPTGVISDEGDPIWVGLQIRYRDVFRNQYISTYCGAYNAHSATFTAYGGPKYNDRHKLSGDELKIAESRDN